MKLSMECISIKIYKRKGFFKNLTLYVLIYSENAYKKKYYRKVSKNSKNFIVRTTQYD